jgi:hypothetical protein
MKHVKSHRTHLENKCTPILKPVFTLVYYRTSESGCNIQYTYYTAEIFIPSSNISPCSLLVSRLVTIKALSFLSNCRSVGSDRFRATCRSADERGQTGEMFICFIRASPDIISPVRGITFKNKPYLKHRQCFISLCVCARLLRTIMVDSSSLN